MAEMVIGKANEKLSKSRQLCPGLSEEVYALADYMAEVVNYNLSATGLLMALMECLDNIRTEKSSVSKYILNNKTQVLAQAVYFPQIVDAVFDKETAGEFRKICRDKLDFDPIRRFEKYDLNADITGDYPEYVKVAANWWANALITPRVIGELDNLDDSSIIFMTREWANLGSDVSKKQIEVFKRELAHNIAMQMECSKKKECRLDVRGSSLLSTVAQKAEMFLFPLEMIMHIRGNKVLVATGKNAPCQTLWKKCKASCNVAG